MEIIATVLCFAFQVYLTAPEEPKHNTKTEPTHITELYQAPDWVVNGCSGEKRCTVGSAKGTGRDPVAAFEDAVTRIGLDSSDVKISEEWISTSATYYVLVEEKEKTP